LGSAEKKPKLGIDFDVAAAVAVALLLLQSAFSALSLPEFRKGMAHFPRKPQQKADRGPKAQIANHMASIRLPCAVLSPGRR